MAKTICLCQNGSRHKNTKFFKRNWPLNAFKVTFCLENLFITRIFSYYGSGSRNGSRMAAPALAPKKIKGPEPFGSGSGSTALILIIEQVHLLCHDYFLFKTDIVLIFNLKWIVLKFCHENKCHDKIMNKLPQLSCKEGRRTIAVKIRAVEPEPEPNDSGSWVFQGARAGAGAAI